MKELLIFSIMIFSISIFSLSAHAANWTGYYDNAAGNITLSIMNISANNSTFKFDCVGGTPNYDIFLYLDGALSWYVNDAATCSGYYWTGSGLSVGWHTVGIFARDYNGVCIDVITNGDFHYCDNDRYGNLISFGIAPKGNINSFTFDLSEYEMNRWSDVAFASTAISGGTPPYRVTIKAYYPNYAFSLWENQNVGESESVYGIIHGYQFISTAADRNYTLIMNVKDSAGNEKEYGSYNILNPLVPLVVHQDQGEVSRVGFTVTPLCNTSYEINNTIYSWPGYWPGTNVINIFGYNKRNEYYKENCTELGGQTLLHAQIAGTPPFNVTLGYYNASMTHGSTSPLCSWVNTYKTDFQLTIIPRIEQRLDLGFFAINDVNAIAQELAFWNVSWNPRVCYLYDPTKFLVMDCVKQGGVPYYAFDLFGYEGVSYNNSDQVRHQTSNDTYCKAWYYNDSLYYNESYGHDNPGIYNFENGTQYTVTGNYSDPFGVNPSVSGNLGVPIGSIGNVVPTNWTRTWSILSDEKMLWTGILIILGIITEIYAKTSGKAFALILILGIIVLSIFGVYPIWVPIIFTLIGGLVAFKLFQGGK